MLCIIGERKMRKFVNEDGTEEMRNSVDLGLTIDERIADGFYYARTVRLLLHILANPELLDKPLGEKIELL